MYGTVHKKNNQLYIFFCFWFLCLLVGVFNLYSTIYIYIYIYIYISFYITIVVHLYGTAHGKVFVYIDDFYFFLGICFLFLFFYYCLLYCNYELVLNGYKIFILVKFFPSSTEILYIYVCVDILTFNKEKKNYYYFSIYI